MQVYPSKKKLTKKKVIISLIFHTNKRLSMHYLFVHLAFGPFIKVSHYSYKHTVYCIIKLEYRVSNTHTGITAEYEIDVENSVFQFASSLCSPMFFLLVVVFSFVRFNSRSA